jgi:S-adenosylmethionine hydrolase
MTTPIITLTSDFGSQDHYVAAMKASILSVSRQLHLVDISHDLPPFSTDSASYITKSCYMSFPKGTIHVVVVDPGVGGNRRPLLIECQEGHYFIGPDNGVFEPILARGIECAFDVSKHQLKLPRLSATFHGRDLFGPIAGYLADGRALEQLGQIVELSTLKRRPESRPQIEESGMIVGKTIHVDRFGNLITNIEGRDLNGPFEVIICTNVNIGPLRRTFTDVSAGQAVAYMGSTDHIEIAVNQGSAVEAFGRSSVWLVPQS